MHQATLTALSVRQDGAGFKAALPDDGEQWLSLPDNLVGKVEWKSSYNVGWTKTPRKTGGFFYNVKQLNPVNTAPPAAQPPIWNNNHQPPSTGNGNGSPVPHSYKDLDIAVQATAKWAGPVMLARETDGEITGADIAEVLTVIEEGVKRWWRTRNKFAAPPPPAPVESIEDTF